MEVWIRIGILLLSSFLQQALASKPPSPKPRSLEDFDIPTAEQGRPLPVIFGTVRVRGSNCIWHGDLGTRPIKSEGGKK